ncbi:MAG TPA: porin family protein [bacterium]|jgi:hypothetical protein|nr:porin family protein [bacterium]
MKKLNLTFGCLLLFVFGSSFALADGAAPGFPAPQFGVEAGFNDANLNGPAPGDVYASRLGFVGGAFLNLPFGPALAFQPELLYEQKGGQVNGNPYRLNYMEVPLLLDVSLVGPLGVILGPAFAANVDNVGVTNPNSTDVGLILGAQLNFSRFLISGRYEVGLTDVSSNQNIQNGTFTFMAGFSFI